MLVCCFYVCAGVIKQSSCMIKVLGFVWWVTLYLVGFDCITDQVERYLGIVHRNDHFL